MVEQEDQLFTHASYRNQARIHNGYHYPRSLQTAYRSRVNFEAFIKDFPECLVSDFTKLYGIARHNSGVSSRQFERFCTVIGAPWRRAQGEYSRLFNPRLIESVYEVTEYAFDSNILRDLFGRRLIQAGVEIGLRRRVEQVQAEGTVSRVKFADGTSVAARYIFNCAYAGLKNIPGLSEHCRTRLKYEIAELAVIDPPAELKQLGITVMCGPFFSMMPFAPRALHTLSHVRYTPHYSWDDQGMTSASPYDVLRGYLKKTRAHHMIKDAERYVPVLGGATVRDSMFELKTVLARNEVDDGRPILMERSESPNRIYSIMGGKIDNIYDVIERLRAEEL